MLRPVFGASLRHRLWSKPLSYPCVQGKHLRPLQVLVQPGSFSRGQFALSRTLGPSTVPLRRFCGTAPSGSLAQQREAPRSDDGKDKGKRYAIEKYDQEYSRSLEDPEGYWLEAAAGITWRTPPSRDRVLDTSNPPFYQWFPDTVVNTCENCVDRHVENGRGDQVAIAFASSITGERRNITYRELQKEVELAAGVLQRHGVGKGDRVVIYMPMVPETPVAMLACARIGAIHSVVFGGFAAHELATRIDDAKPKVIISASCGLEGSSVLPYKPLLDEAIKRATHPPESCVILQRPQCEASLVEGRDFDWQKEMELAKPAGIVPVEGTHPSYIIYTSGSTGQPKGVVRDSAGHLVALKHSMELVYGVKPGDVWWAASDVGWVVGHSYIVYAPLLHGCTSVLFEGKPVGTPDAGTFWRLVRELGVSVLFTAPTALRAIKREDPEASWAKADGGIPTLQALFLAGERSDPATVQWAQDFLGIDVIDHYWQTEFGWAVLGNCRGLGLHATKPGSATKPVPGWNLRVVHPAPEDGQEYFAIRDTVESSARDIVSSPRSSYHAGIHEADELAPVAADELGALIARLPLPPSALMSLWRNDARFRASYTDAYPGYFETGDACIVDKDGYYHVMARTDDVLNVAGHRLSSGGIEAVVAAHPDVAECAVVGVANDLKGQVPVVFVVLKTSLSKPQEEILAEVGNSVRQEVGRIATIEASVVVPRLPKTRSGKVLRGTMKAIADGTPYRFPATIDDPAILDEVSEALKAAGYPKGAE